MHNMSRNINDHGLILFFSANRRGGLMVNNAISLVAAIFLGFSKLAGSFEMFVIGRALIGIFAGKYWINHSSCNTTDYCSPTVKPWNNWNIMTLFHMFCQPCLKRFLYASIAQNTTG